MFAQLAKQAIMAFIQAKWPNARIEFKVRIGHHTYITQKWDVVMVDLHEQHIQLEVDARDGALEVEAIPARRKR